VGFFSTDSVVLLFSRTPVLGVADFFSDNWLSGASTFPLCCATAGDEDLLLAVDYKKQQFCSLFCSG